MMNETTEERYGRNRNGRRGRGSGFIIITINPTREGRCRDGRNVGKGKGVEWEIGKGIREERGGETKGVKGLRQRRELKKEHQRQKGSHGNNGKEWEGMEKEEHQVEGKGRDDDDY